jgi:hypothetical protein
VEGEELRGITAIEKGGSAVPEMLKGERLRDTKKVKSGKGFRSTLYIERVGAQQYQKG